MKTLPLFSKLTALSLAALSVGAGSLHAQHVWSGNSSATYNWGSASNWNTLPSEPADQQVRFDSYSGASPTVVLDQDRQLNAGIFFRAGTTNSGKLTLNLDNQRLTLNGSTAQFDPSSAAASSRTTVEFTNGTVQFGAANATTLTMGATSGDGYAGNASSTLGVVFTDTATFDSTHLQALQIASSSASRLQNLELDLSQASLTSGANSDTLSILGELAVGNSLNAGPAAERHKYGSLKLGVLSTLHIGGDLSLGTNVRTNGNNTNARGTLTFSSSPLQGVATLHVGGHFKVGVGAGASGTIEQAPETLHTEIGSSSARGGAIQIGYKASTASASGDASGTFAAQDGSFTAYATELRIGQNLSSGGSATGELDMSHATLSVLDIAGAAFIGDGTDASGSVSLKGGAANSTDLSVGTSTSPSASALSLNGTHWTISNQLAVGSSGSVSIVVTDQGPAGFTLLSSTGSNFVIHEDGRITISFESDAPSWGLRMAGDHTSLFTTYQTENQLIASGTYGSLASVYLEDGYTYFGTQAIPEPSTYALLGLFTAGAVILRFRRR